MLTPFFSGGNYDWMQIPMPVNALIVSFWYLRWMLIPRFFSPWNILGHVDSEIYGMPTSCSSRRQV
jgi:hypothetical protein